MMMGMSMTGKDKSKGSIVAASIATTTAPTGTLQAGERSWGIRASKGIGLSPLAVSAQQR